jgi:hypothetical protein
MKKLLMLIFILGLGNIAFGQVTVSIAKGISGSTGDTLVVPITVSSLTGQNVTGYDLGLIFDPAVIRPVGFDTSGTRTTKTPTSSFFYIVDNVDNVSSGIYYFVYAGTDPLTGSGQLIKFKCLVLSGSGTGRSPLQLSGFRFNEGTPSAVISQGSFGRPYEPTLVSPVNTESVPSTTVLFRWNTTTGAVTYRLQVSTNSGFTSLFYNDSTLTDTSKSLSGLSVGATYYWRVNAKNGIGTSGYSSQWSFSTTPGPPPVPTLVSPANDSTGLPTSPTLTWTVSPNATSYRLQVSTSSAFPSTVFDDSTLTGTSQALSGLAKGITYFWHVRSKGTNGSSNFSTTFNFTTIFPGPPTPTLVSPADSAVDVPLAPTLMWNASSGALKYRLQVSTSSSFAATVFDDSTITGTQGSLSGLANYTLYYWRVSANNAEGWSAYSTRRQFRTFPLPPSSAPTLTSPADGATGVRIEPTTTMSWTAVPTASRYHLQMASTAEFLSIFIDDTSITGTTTGVMGLARNQNFFWRVAARNAAGEGPMSASRSFLTGLLRPILLSPGDGAIDQPVPLTLVWIADTMATSYHIQVSTSTGFLTTVVNDTTDTATMVVPHLDLTRTYYWRVCSGNADGEGNYSEIWQFTTGATGIEQTHQTLPKEFNLSQNYPNPFNPTTKIQYSIPKQSFVSIVIFDMLGHRIRTLVSEMKSPGIYNLTVDGSSLASGMYFYTMKSGNFTMSKKFVLMK